MMNYLERISDFVREIEAQYKISKGLILSEDDVKCILYAKIYNQLEQENQLRQPIDDPDVYASPLHTEIKFIDANGTLSVRPDISIVDTASMTMRQSLNGFAVSRKGFIIYGSATVVEIKFCKNSSGITNRFSNSIRRDCDKIIDLKNRLYPPGEAAMLQGIVVVFNRTNKVSNGFLELCHDYGNHPYIKILYASGDFLE